MCIQTMELKGSYSTACYQQDCYGEPCYYNLPLIHNLTTIPYLILPHSDRQPTVWKFSYWLPHRKSFPYARNNVGEPVDVGYKYASYLNHFQLTGI